jgi:hypothetical protein
MDVAAYSPKQLEQQLEFYGFPRLPGDPCDGGDVDDAPAAAAADAARKVIARPIMHSSEQAQRAEQAEAAQQPWQAESAGEESVEIEHVPATFVENEQVRRMP